MGRKKKIKAVIFVWIVLSMFLGQSIQGNNSVQEMSISSIEQEDTPADIQIDQSDLMISENQEEGRWFFYVYWMQMKENLYEYLYKYSDETFAPKMHQIVTYVVDVIANVPILFVLLLLSVVFASNLIVVAVVLMITSFYKSGREVYKKTLDDRCEEILIGYLFGEVSLNEVADNLSNVKSRFGKNVLIDLLYNYQQNLSGEYSERILLLYKELNLDGISGRKTKSFFSSSRIKGIRELASLYPSDAKELIVKLVKDRNIEVRSEAQIAYVFLDSQSTFNFLENLESSLSTWVQLNILSYLKMNEKQVPSFGKYISSNNNDVQDFSIRMIDYFQQNENAHLVLDLLDHPHPQTRYYVYQAIRHLELEEAIEKVKAKFKEETYPNRIEILKILGDLGGGSDLDIFQEVLSRGNIRLKLQACRTLYNMGEKGRSLLNKNSEIESMGLEPFIEHIKDKRN